jgi:hypothetical protein
MCEGEVIAKLVEDAYFMRVDNGVTQVPPLRTREADHEATSHSPADNGRNCTRGELPQNPDRTRASAGGPSQGGNSAGGAGGSRGAAAHGDAGGGGSGGGSSSHGAGRRAGGGDDRGGRGHADSHVTGVSRGGYDARCIIEEIRRKKSSTGGENDDFPAFSARLRNLLLSEKFKPLGITKYDAKQDPVQWLKFYALSIENAGGNNDTKFLYFPFCLDQAPLTWLESLKKFSIDKWDQLKEQSTSNYAGVMGQSGTRMDLAMVRREQGETLRKYMRCFFDKRATAVDATDKEVIDLFKDGLYHRRTFEDFGPRRPSSITKLNDMITSWADEEDKANAKYDAIHGKSKENAGDNNNNRDQGGRNNNYSSPNRKRKPDNTVASIQRPAKDNSKKTSGGLKDLLKEKCLWHLEGNHTTAQCYQLRRALKDSPNPRPPHDKKGKKKATKDNDDFQEPDKTVNVLFGVLPTKRSQKAIRREVLNIEPAVPTPLRWSEVPITFSRADQWASFSEPRRFPLVLKPIVAVSRLNKVLIDGGRELNVLFTKTLKKMKLDITHILTKSTSPFYGIVPGNEAIPLGSVVLPVTFGETRENYRTEYIKFEVADFETSYHAILGRPAITKFMAVPQYTYLVLKMPSPAGVLSLQGDLKISFDCDTEAVELAATNQVPNTWMEIYAASKKLAPTELESPEKSYTANKPQPSEEVQVKAIDLGTGDSSKTTMIRAGLDPK